MSHLSVFRRIRNLGDIDTSEDGLPQELSEDIYAYDAFEPTELMDFFGNTFTSDKSKLERFKNYILAYFDKEEDARPYLEAIEKK